MPKLGIQHLLVDETNCPRSLVYRVGRTGRAGRKGHAITFITPEEDRFAPDMLNALKASPGQVIPEDLEKLAETFMKKVKDGIAKFVSNHGYRGTKGYKFDEAEAAEAKVEEMERRSGYLVPEEGGDMAAVIEEEKKGLEAKKQEEKEKKEQKAKEAEEKDLEDPISKQLMAAKAAAAAAAKALSQKDSQQKTEAVLEAKKVVLDLTKDAAAQMSKIKEKTIKIGAAAAKAFAKELSMKHQELGKTIPMIPGIPANPDMCYEEFEVNEYPQHARWKATHRESLREVMELTDTTITTKGIYVAPGRKPMPGERKLYLLIEGKSALSVSQAKAEIRRICEEAAVSARPEKSMYSKYSVV